MATVQSGAQSFALASAFCGIPCDPSDIHHRFQGECGFGVPEMLRAAKTLGLKVRVSLLPPDRLGKAPLPALAQDRDGALFLIGRFALDAKGQVEKLLIQRAGGPPQSMTLEEFRAVSDGRLVHVARKNLVH